MLLVSAGFSILVATIVAIFGQDKKVKFPFSILCISTGILSLGLWVETRFEDSVLLAAKINMTTALIGSCFALLSTRLMAKFPVNKWIVFLFFLGAFTNIITVWLTDVYLTGKIIRYHWGFYAEGDIRFVLNPILVTMISLYCIFSLISYYRAAHPFDKNRILYFVTSFSILALSLLDYLPHFYIDLFGFAVSSFAIPAFLAIFGYSCLRYRLLEFSELAVIVYSNLLVFFITILVYYLSYQLVDFTFNNISISHISAAISSFLIYLSLGKFLLKTIQEKFSKKKSILDSIVREFGEELAVLKNEDLCWNKTEILCTRDFSANHADRFLPKRTDEFTEDFSGQPIETEIYFRLKGMLPTEWIGFEVIVPVVRHEEILIYIGLGGRKDGRQYPLYIISALRSAAAFYAIAIASIRSALEVERRHRLDRYMAPQLVEKILSQDLEPEKKTRCTITVFFSDLKGFSSIADRLDPEILSVVLNEYFSEMSQIAFAFDGTIDKFIGDAIMVIFGAPIPMTEKEQAIRAVKMGISMQNKLRELNVRWNSKNTIYESFEARMGISQGEATVGSFGSATRADFTAIGSVVNLASRLEGSANPGRILISKNVSDLICEEILVHPWEPIRVKGFNDPVNVSEIIPE